MDLVDLRNAVLGYDQKGHPEKIKILGWFLHVYRGQDAFQAGHIKACYDKLHDTPPSSFSGYMTNLVDQKFLLKNAAGFRLSGALRAQLEQAYAPKGNKLKVTELLLQLPAKIPDLSERKYLDETLICYEHGALRAAVVMAWNLAYHHLCAHIMVNDLARFNARWLISLPGQHKNGAKTIQRLDDFAELRESDVITIAKDAGVITKDIWRIMDEKLGKRNSAAHPSSISIGQLQTDALIVDLVENVVLLVK